MKQSHIKTSKIVLVVFCVCVYLITSCEDKLYFDSAPQSNMESVKKELKKWQGFTGVYKLKFKFLDSAANQHDQFKNNKYDDYIMPVLKKNFDDTLEYLATSVFFGRRYLEITEHKGVCHFLSFDCVNKNIFDRFFKSGTRIIREKGQAPQLVTIVFKNDSVKIKIKVFENGLLHDTSFKFKVWLRGELLCLYNEPQALFPKLVDLNSNNNDTFHYFSVVKNQLCYIQKDTADGETKFEISNLRPDTSSFMLKTLYAYDMADTVLKNLGVKYEKGGLAHYNESQLASIYNSPLASEDIVATRIDGFPLLSEDSGVAHLLVKYWYIMVIIFLMAIVVLKNKQGKWITPKDII